MPAAMSVNNHVSTKSWFNIRRMMMLAGAVLVAAVALIGFLNISSLEENRIGSPSFVEIEEGWGLVADIAPPPLMPFEAYAIVQFAADEPPEALKNYEPRLQELKKAQSERLKFWDEKMQNTSLLDRTKWDEIHAGFEKRSGEFWGQLENNVLPAIRRADEAGKETALAQLEELLKNYIDFVNPATDYISRAADDQRAASQEQSDRSLQLVIAVSVALALFVALLVVLGQTTIVRAIARLSGAMSDLAGGDLGIDVPYESRRDEIGEMARSLAVFRSTAQRSHDSAAETEAVIKSLGSGLEAMSAGNLTVRLDHPFPAGLDPLRTYFNDAVHSLQQTISSVKLGTDGIKSGTEDIAQASDDLSRRTETQAANLEETAAAVAEITGKVKQTASGAIHARAVVESTKSEADRSGEIVRKAVDAMQQIENSSQRITQIISVIDEIAFQTNLLALNAGVEAARAGDAGRGFAVVASEVRALAQRSADAAREIKSLLSTSQDAVQQGVSLVAETGTSLKSIIDRVAEINGIVAEIAASAEQQASGLQEVNTAVDQMDQVTQQNASMVEETTAATRTLTQQSAELATMVARFSVAATASLERHEAAQRRASQATHKPVQRAPSPPRRAAASAATAIEDWQEF